MDFLSLFRKTTPQDRYRKMVRGVFKATVRDAKRRFVGIEMMDAMLLQTAIETAYKELKTVELPESPFVEMITHGWSTDDVIDEECLRVLKKNLVMYDTGFMF